MAKQVNKTTKASSSRKRGLKSAIKTTKVGATKFRLAGNHNETLVK